MIQQRTQAMAAFQEKMLVAEKELDLREIMGNPDGKLYQTYYNRPSHFAKKSSNAEFFEMAMRKSFDEVMAD